MTEQEKHEQNLYSLTKKAEALDSVLKVAHFRMRRTLKNLKACKDMCKQTNEIIGELNARNNEHK